MSETSGAGRDHDGSGPADRSPIAWLDTWHTADMPITVRGRWVPLPHKITPTVERLEAETAERYGLDKQEQLPDGSP